MRQILLREEPSMINPGVTTEIDRLINDGQFSDAEAYCRRALKSRSATTERDDLSVVILMNRLAWSLERQKRFAEAFEIKLSSQNLMVSLMEMP